MAGSLDECCLDSREKGTDLILMAVLFDEELGKELFSPSGQDIGILEKVVFESLDEFVSIE